jgi:YaiO family outer membrane protein
VREVRTLLATAGALFALALCARPALAGCTAPASAKTLTVEAGVTTDSVTNHPNWSEQSLTVLARNGNYASLYGRAASDQRFGATDPSYELGTYTALGPHFIGMLDGSVSPTHIILPATTESAGLDWRSNGGYGYQAQYAQRNYTAQNAGIVSLSGDRYAGVNRYTLGVTLASVTNVPGIALTTRGTFARYFTCDEESYSIAGGRDVESTGVAGQIAVYKALSFDANVVHWFSQRFGVNAGAGWYLLIGAYNRFELRIALRERS